MNVITSPSTIVITTAQQSHSPYLTIPVGPPAWAYTPGGREIGSRLSVWMSLGSCALSWDSSPQGSALRCLSLL
jgi:hypothetical protein